MYNIVNSGAVQVELFVPPQLMDSIDADIHVTPHFHHRKLLRYKRDFLADIINCGGNGVHTPLGDFYPMSEQNFPDGAIKSVYVTAP